jgi:hypothetical protein
MSDRYFYGPDGEYRGRSTSGGANWAPLVMLVAGLWGLELLAKWCRGFLYSPHPQPYQIIADIYRVLFEMAGDVGGAFVHLNPTPYHNLNGVILLVLTAVVAIGILYLVGAAAERLRMRKRRLASLVGLVVAFPALVGLSWWTIVALFHWLFAKAG